MHFDNEKKKEEDNKFDLRRPIRFSEEDDMVDASFEEYAEDFGADE